jgi:hypothetical protein
MRWLGTFPILSHDEVSPVYSTRVTRLTRDKHRRTIELLNNKTDPSLTNSIKQLSYLQTPRDSHPYSGFEKWSNNRKLCDTSVY